MAEISAALVKELREKTGTGMMDCKQALAASGGDMAMVVHGGQSIRLHRPIPASGTFETTGTIKGIYDMRKFAIVAIETRVTHEGKLLAETSSNIIFRGAGGFGGAAGRRSGIAGRA